VGRPPPTPDDDDDHASDDDTVDPGRWTGAAQVQVVDTEGQPVEGAYALIGGADDADWKATDADGRATVVVDDDGITDRWLLAGKEGYITGGVDLDDVHGPSDVSTLVIYALPDPEDDNLDYAFQPGGDSSSPDMSECGHCHPTIGDDWAGSMHRDAARNERLWDVYVGGRDLDATSCEELGGWMAEGQQPGIEDGTAQRCYLGEGVLPFLHDFCGGQDEQACDHPQLAESLDAFGSCGDCHAPAVEQTLPGAIDLARATGLAHDEGVSCDLCHKIRSVEPGPAPGRDGAIALQRPSEPTQISGQEFDPITFGPYPDVAMALMKGSYAPAMRDPGWCSACHEYARPALHPQQVVDAERWPDGLPLFETYSEYLAGPYADAPDTCQTCHMIPLDEESSTYDITPQGLAPSLTQGWLRDLGEVRHHEFGEPGLAAAGLYLELSLEGDEVMVIATVQNSYAGHAIPTGSPLRQLVLRLDAVDGDGAPVPAVRGQSVPGEAGWRHQGVVDGDVIVDGATLVFAEPISADVAAARFVRPTGEWDDYAGPGTSSFDGIAASEKGLPLFDVVGEVAVLSIAGATAELAGPAPDVLTGDRVYLVGPDDAAGAPGWLYGKVLADAEGKRGVSHYRAVDMAFDNRIAPQTYSNSTHYFPAPATGELTVTAVLTYRRHAATVADRYGWELGDEELARVTRTYDAE